jgi:RNA polymerase primary sigma factor
MATKDSMKSIEALFQSKKKGDVVTLENISKEFTKQPTAAQAKKIHKLSIDGKVEVVSASEYAKFLTNKEKRRKEDARKKLTEGNAEDQFDLHKEKELLEWSRSDSPVRMYLREMGKIPLLTKEEEVDLSKRIEEGEDIIIDAICSVHLHFHMLEVHLYPYICHHHLEVQGLHVYRYLLHLEQWHFLLYHHLNLLWL